MNGRLFSYYGDDFTGSTDALEALAANGVRTVLFLEPPDEGQLAQFAGSQAIGIAGDSRSRNPDWMSEHLPPVFRTLKAFGAPICQYKVCSTFDSSPEHGSIGRALELGQDQFGNACVPIVVAAPHLKRYVLFGNLFAAGPDGATYRIDRHPGMAHHPVTPMREADLRRHLGWQTGRPIALLDVVAVHGSDPEAHLDELLATEHPAAVLFDGFDETSLSVVGRLVWTRRSVRHVFAIGSSGLTHALIRHWRQQGVIEPHVEIPAAREADRLLVVSGSCSPVTEGQLRWSMRNGFEGIRFDADADSRPDPEERAVAALASGRSVVLYTALGPFDCGGSLRGDTLGQRLGSLLRRLILTSGVRRVLVAGGDTSSHAVRQLGVHALTFAALTTPGAPLCRCHSIHPALDGLEIVLKGGPSGNGRLFRKGTKRQTMKAITLLGAGGKMGLRITDNLRKSDYEVRYVEVSDHGKTALAERGITVVTAEEALSESEAVILALPDNRIARITGELNPHFRPGCMLIALDIGAPLADHLPCRDDLVYFVSHPCHPSVFGAETDPDAQKDFFGGTKARQNIVCALVQGPDAHYDVGERIARVIYAPVGDSHRCTAEQMAILEPVLSETVLGTCLTVIGEAMEEAVKRGVPEAAARDFLLGHLKVELGIIFKLFPGATFSDGALSAIDEAKRSLFQPDWKKVFEPAAIAESIRKITKPGT